MESSGNPSGDERFTSHGATAEDLLKSQTVGLVNLSDFRKRRAEAQDVKDREASTSLRGIDSEDVGQGSDSSGVSSIPKKKKKKAAVKSKLSFAADGDDDDLDTSVTTSRSLTPAQDGQSAEESGKAVKQKRFGANSSLLAPKALTKTMRLKEAEEREALRKHFMTMQETVKTTEFLIPFVFFDGANADGGVCKVKKGDRIWLFLDKARKVGSDKSGAADKGTASRREWSRMSVDDLMMVRGDIILPHHFEFYYFIANKIKGHASRVLFPYSTQLSAEQLANDSPLQQPKLDSSKTHAANKSINDGTLEGGIEEPTFTKVVDRRWYERNKHIWPASVWEEFDSSKDYTTTQRKDAQGNSFFF